MTLLETFFNGEVLLSSFPALMRGLMTTLALGVMSIICGTIAGLLVTLARLYGPRPLQLACVVYVDVFRALPMLVVLIVIYYALPFVGVRLSAWTSAILALSVVLSAYSSEVFRAGIEAVPKGQFEAAANSLQGSGWAMLVWDTLGQRLNINQLYDQQNNLPVGQLPVLQLDMWEHAFYLQYKNVKADYVKSWWNVVNWTDVADRLAKSRAVVIF